MLKGRGLLKFDCLFAVVFRLEYGSTEHEEDDCTQA